MAFITAIGGLEAIKWLVRLVTYRKMDARKEEASVSCMKEQEDKMGWMIRCHEVELAQKETEIKKCEIRGCGKRIPPSDY